MSSLPGKLHTLASAPSAKVPVKKKKKGPVKLNAFGYDDDSSATESGDEGGLTAGDASQAQNFQSFGGASSSWERPPIQHASSSGAASSSVQPRVADHELFSYHDSGTAMPSAPSSAMSAAFDQLFDPSAEASQPAQNFGFGNESMLHGFGPVGDSFVKQRETWNILGAFFIFAGELQTIHSAPSSSSDLSGTWPHL